MFINSSEKNTGIVMQKPDLPILRKRSVIKNILAFTGIIGAFLTAVAAWFMVTLFMEPDISPLPSWHPFTSMESKYIYLRYYNNRSKKWPVPSESRFVNTSFGKTYVRISGEAELPPLVLLPPVGSSSLIWMQNIKSLSEHFRVYAVDNIYDAGLSVYTRPTKKASDIVSWLDELFTGLELKDKINLMGFSLGGWYTAQYALKFQSRLNKIVMLAPAGTVKPISFDFVWRALLAAIPHRYFMESMSKWAFGALAEKQDAESQKLYQEMVDDSFMNLKCFKFKMPVEPTVLSDDELKSIKIPALFLVGEQEVVYPAAEAVKRLNDVAPDIKTEIIPGASHDLIFTQTEMVNKKVIDFLLK